MSTDFIALLRSRQQNRLADALEEGAPQDRADIEKQLAALDLEVLPSLIAEYVLKKPDTALPSDLQPAPFFEFPPKSPERAELYEKAEEFGASLIRQGKVAALTVAGGQGTRLGFDGPKGTYPIAPVSGKSLFQYFAESLARISEKFNASLPWYIMTSELNDPATRAFFETHAFFGLNPENVHFFPQGVMPAISYDGDLILASKNSLALAPDGHGGTLLALRTSGALDEMARNGVEYISYFQVDNPLVPVIDPLFIGLHALEKAQMSCRMLPKTNAFEKLGNFCLSNGRLHVIEYSDMPDELAQRKKHDGTLDFIAGSPAIHVISRDFVAQLTASGRLSLPWHRADKKVAFLNPAGLLVQPEEPNAVKLESFIFDALPLATKTMVLEGCREELFAPTKNKTGVDSVESCRAMLSARDARRLRLAGVNLPEKPDGTPDCVVEISPRLVSDDADAVLFLGAATPPGHGEAKRYGE